VKLSSVVTDLLGVSARRILQAMAAGESDVQKLASLGSERLKAKPEQLREALEGRWLPRHRQLLRMHLEELSILDRHIEELGKELAEAMKAHEPEVMRLCEMPGIRGDAARQILAEIGPDASAFASAGNLASWVGCCPGRQESAGESKSNRSAKGSRPMRRLMVQVAWAAVRTKGCHFQELFNRFVPSKGVNKAIWAVAHRILQVIWKVVHQKVQYIEKGPASGDPNVVERLKRNYTRKLRKLGFSVEVTPMFATTGAPC